MRKKSIFTALLFIVLMQFARPGELSAANAELKDCIYFNPADYNAKFEGALAALGDDPTTEENVALMAGLIPGIEAQPANELAGDIESLNADISWLFDPALTQFSQAEIKFLQDYTSANILYFFGYNSDNPRLQAWLEARGNQNEESIGHLFINPDERTEQQVVTQNLSKDSPTPTIIWDTFGFPTYQSATNSLIFGFEEYAYKRAAMFLVLQHEGVHAYVDSLDIDELETKVSDGVPFWMDPEAMARDYVLYHDYYEQIGTVLADPRLVNPDVPYMLVRADDANNAMTIGPVEVLAVAMELYTGIVACGGQEALLTELQEDYPLLFPDFHRISHPEVN